MNDNHTPSTHGRAGAWLLLAINLLLAPVCAARSSQSPANQIPASAADSPEPLGTVIVPPFSPTALPNGDPGVRVDYPAGWNLVAGSGSPIVGADGPLYTFQAGDSDYRVVSGSIPLQSNQGYWAYFDEPVQEESPAFATTYGVALPPGQWIMVGHATNAYGTITRPPPDLLLFTYNAITQAYERTLYIAPGQGAWAFSETGGTLLFNPPGAPPHRPPILPQGAPPSSGGAQQPRTPGATAALAGTRSVVLAVQRDRQLSAYDMATLEPLGTVVINIADSVQPRADGRMLFIRQTDSADGSSGCCALFSLDLASGAMCRLIFPSAQPVPVPASRVFNQRGNAGIEVFDAQTLRQLPTIAAPGVYALLPSPDGRWLFGITGFPTAALNLFDVATGVLASQMELALPGAGAGAGANVLPWFTGAWLNGRFYIYANDGTAAYLWSGSPDDTQLSAPTRVAIEVPDLADSSLPRFPSALVAGNGQLFLYERRGWWFKSNDRAGMPGGGVFTLDPASGAVTAEMAPNIDFAQVVTSDDGRELVGIDAGDPRDDRPVRMLALDPETGAVLQSRTLATDVWSIAAAMLPEALLPLGDVLPAACSRQ